MAAASRVCFEDSKLQILNWWMLWSTTKHYISETFYKFHFVSHKSVSNQIQHSLEDFILHSKKYVLRNHFLKERWGHTVLAQCFFRYFIKMIWVKLHICNVYIYMYIYICWIIFVECILIYFCNHGCCFWLCILLELGGVLRRLSSILSPTRIIPFIPGSKLYNRYNIIDY